MAEELLPQIWSAREVVDVPGSSSSVCSGEFLHLPMLGPVIVNIMFSFNYYHLQAIATCEFNIN